MYYTHLTEAERYQIYSLKQAGHKVPFIACQLSRHPSTIYRELKRNLVFDPHISGYSPSRAHHQARHRVMVRAYTKRISKETWQQVESHLRCRHSPEQVSGELAHKGTRISHERIYQYIWADKRRQGDLWTFLRGKLRRDRRYRINQQRGQIVGRIGIECRPTIANDRRRRGDYEIDTVFGKGRKAPLVTIVDRRTKFVVVEQAASKHAEGVANSLIRRLQGTGRRTHTITADNGKEFAQHQRVAKTLKAGFFFTRPYASWERGPTKTPTGCYDSISRRSVTSPPSLRRRSISPSTNSIIDHVKPSASEPLMSYSSLDQPSHFEVESAPCFSLPIFMIHTALSDESRFSLR